jgi:hypothetical protein
VSNIEQRTCRLCGKEKPLNEEHFPTAATRKSGKVAFRTECIECRRDAAKEYRKKYYAENKNKVLRGKRKYEAENEDAIRKYQAEYRARKKNEGESA